MTAARWLVDSPDNVVELDGHRFGSGDNGAPMLCNLVCRYLIHFRVSRSTELRTDLYIAGTSCARRLLVSIQRLHSRSTSDLFLQP